MKNRWKYLVLSGLLGCSFFAQMESVMAAQTESGEMQTAEEVQPEETAKAAAYAEDGWEEPESALAEPVSEAADMQQETGAQSAETDPEQAADGDELILDVSAETEETRLLDEASREIAERQSELEAQAKEAERLYEQLTGESFAMFVSYPAGNVVQNTNEIYDYLREELGLNHAAACGVLANIQCESDFSATALGDGGTSYGLCQWHLDRFSRLIGWCRANGYDYHFVPGQMGYLGAELQSGYQNVYQYLLGVPDTAQGAYDAADYWCRYFEIPSNLEYQSIMRAKLAKNEFYPRVLGGTAQAEAGEEGTTVLGSWDTGDSIFFHDRLFRANSDGMIPEAWNEDAVKSMVWTSEEQ